MYDTTPRGTIFASRFFRNNRGRRCQAIHVRKALDEIDQSVAPAPLTIVVGTDGRSSCCVEYGTAVIRLSKPVPEIVIGSLRYLHTIFRYIYIDIYMSIFFSGILQGWLVLLQLVF